MRNNDIYHYDHPRHRNFHCSSMLSPQFDLPRFWPSTETDQTTWLMRIYWYNVAPADKTALPDVNFVWGWVLSEHLQWITLRATIITLLYVRLPCFDLWDFDLLDFKIWNVDPWIETFKITTYEISTYGISSWLLPLWTMASDTAWLELAI